MDFVSVCHCIKHLVSSPMCLLLKYNAYYYYFYCCCCCYYYHYQPCKLELEYDSYIAVVSWWGWSFSCWRYFCDGYFQHICTCNQHLQHGCNCMYVWKRVHKIVSPTFPSGRMKAVRKDIKKKIPPYVAAVLQYCCVCFGFGQMFSIMLHHSNNLLENIRRLEDMKPSTSERRFGLTLSMKANLHRNLNERL